MRKINIKIPYKIVLYYWGLGKVSLIIISKILMF